MDGELWLIASFMATISFHGAQIIEKCFSLLLYCKRETKRELVSRENKLYIFVEQMRNSYILHLYLHTLW